MSGIPSVAYAMHTRRPQNVLGAMFPYPENTTTRQGERTVAVANLHPATRLQDEGTAEVLPLVKTTACEGCVEVIFLQLFAPRGLQERGTVEVRESPVRFFHLRISCDSNAHCRTFPAGRFGCMNSSRVDQKDFHAAKSVHTQELALTRQFKSPSQEVRCGSEKERSFLKQGCVFTKVRAESNLRNFG